MAATLILTRRANLVELWRFPFDILVDGADVGSIEREKTVETPVEPGPHTLRLRRGRYSSPARSFDAADGDTISFRCHGADLWPRFVASLIVPNLAIVLTHE